MRHITLIGFTHYFDARPVWRYKWKNEALGDFHARSMSCFMAST